MWNGGVYRYGLGCGYESYKAIESEEEGIIWDRIDCAVNININIG